MILYKRIFLALLSMALPMLMTGQDEGYHIEIEVDNYQHDSLFLGHYLGKSQYLSDTAVLSGTEGFVFKGPEKLKPGVYLVVLRPKNEFFQIVVPYEDQNFRISTNALAPMDSMEISGSLDNRLFHDYMSFLADQRPVADSLRTLMEAAEESEKDSIQQQLTAMDKRVREYQENIVSEYPASVTSVIVKAGWEPDLPEFEAKGDELKRKRYFYYKDHYFDHLDLSDPRLVRSPILFGKVDYFVNKLVPQHPDSIARALDTILQAMLPNKEAFQFYLVHFLNHYAKSKVVGMDAVYVSLVENYYMPGHADWTDEETLQKIIENAKSLKPILIGKKAPNVTLESRAGEKVELYELESPLTVLYFWRPDCPHCKESTPKLIEFYKEYRDRGVEVLAICMKFTKDVPKCWEYVDSKEGMDLWVNLVDPYHRSKFATLYDVKTTPMIFLLDEDKTILSKRIGVEQLPELVDHFLSLEAGVDK